MSTETQKIQDLANQEYKYGFYTDIETDSAPPGLNEDIIRLISAKKEEPEFMLEWRLKAYKHWLTMKEPTWANVQYPPGNLQETGHSIGRAGAFGRGCRGCGF
jgi:Fe-S cluster assembly protein SufB